MSTAEGHEPPRRRTAAGPRSGPGWHRWATTVNRGAVIRAALATALPLAVGLMADRPLYGALVAMGALNGITSDNGAGYRTRIRAIALPQLAGAVGLLSGAAVFGRGWLTVAVVTATALVSGLISALGPVASASGLLLLLNTVVGAGLPMPGPWWLPPTLMTLGALLVLAFALLAWPLRPWAPERAAVAQAYRAVAELLFCCADGAAAKTDYDEARRKLTHALDKAYDLLAAHRPRQDEGSEPARLTARLDALTHLIEAAPAIRIGARETSPGLPAALHRAADAVAAGRPWERADTAVTAGRENAGKPVNDPTGGRPAGSPDGLGRFLALPAASWRYGIRLAACIGLAQAVISLVPVPRSYWVPLTVTFVLKPDFGSVFSRAVLRVAGTVPGLAVAAVVFVGIPRGWWDVPVVLCLAALIPALTPRGYGHQTAAITPLILLLSDMLSHQGAAVVLPRLLDSAIGCAIALVAGYLLWPESWHTRVGARLADAVEDLARYSERSLGTSATAPSSPGELRRRLYRDLSAVRTELQRALGEPAPAGSRALSWWPLVTAVERAVDATTAARIQVTQGSAAPTEADVTDLGCRISRLAHCLRRTPAEQPSRPAEVLGAPPGTSDVLEPLRREVTAMEAAARSLTPAGVASSRVRRRREAAAVSSAQAECRGCGRTRSSSGPTPDPSPARPRSR